MCVHLSACGDVYPSVCMDKCAYLRDAYTWVWMAVLCHETLTLPVTLPTSLKVGALCRCRVDSLLYTAAVSLR